MRRLKAESLKDCPQEFSRTESRILEFLSKLDEFLLNPQIRTHSGIVPGTFRNTNVENQGTNEDDSHNDPHPEAGLFRSQTTQNSDPEVGHDIVTGVIEETHNGPDMETRVIEETHNGPDVVTRGSEEIRNGPDMVTGGSEEIRNGPDMVTRVIEETHNGPDMVTGVIEETHNGYDMVTGAIEEIHNRHDMVTRGSEEIRYCPHMVTAVQEEIPSCSPGNSSGKQKKTSSTSQPQFRSEKTLPKIGADQIFLALQQLATNSNSANVITTTTESQNCLSPSRQQCPPSKGNQRNLNCLKIYSKRV